MLAQIINEEIDGRLFFSKICNESLKNLIPYNLQNGDTLFLEGLEKLAEEEIAYLNKILNEMNDEYNSNGNLPNFRFTASISQNAETLMKDNAEFQRLVDYISKVELRIEPMHLRKHELREVIAAVFEKKKKERFSVAEIISEELFELLAEYNWPLNFDELEVIIESLLITCQEPLVLQKHLHQLDFSDIANTKYPTLNDIVDEHIKKALRLTKGNKSRAAKMLGITPKTLYARIRN